MPPGRDALNPTSVFVELQELIDGPCLLDAWMHGEDGRPYLALNLRAEAEAGRPLAQILGLHLITLDGYAAGAPRSRPEEPGFE